MLARLEAFPLQVLNTAKNAIVVSSWVMERLQLAAPSAISHALEIPPNFAVDPQH